MAIRTVLCDLLGIEHPVMLAGMGGVSYAEVCAAVSAAGGFGSLGMAGTSPSFIESQMKRVRALTDRPFGVDLLAAQPETLEASVDIIIREGARAFIAGLGVPYPIVRRLKDAGVLVAAVIGKVDHARKAEAAGCDFVIAQGTEGGGHTGQVASVALWPQVVDAVRIPVVAAGGLFDGRGLAAALALGCVGVWMGTRFIASVEAHAGQVYKDAIVRMTEADTVISRGFTGKTLRALKNRTTERFEREEAKPFPLQALESAQANRLGPIAGITENLDPETQCFAAGQGGGGVREILPAAEIVRRTVAEAEDVMGRIARLAA
ncbi:MAG: nitronate monooxygenase [Sphingomonadaceae bacterium]|uniref:NAD(P)H-dependent flavin oxidoreductase n=1 Tax=Thermaurantiacus sp. TaxID=2820283 RepID=UPI00298F1356|nr:nitronate monooxygenase [Thermaurantiacus sp.]MCS6985858.1 nitronate monooxygenase [Sphingomonadaceae bacterium]MDW8413873.1 nitronate monooxygenase [Thermaurantiacus sp.]